MNEFALKRLGVLMQPEPNNPLEVEGVLNPAVTRGPDGALYLFPRLVAKGNFSRIGIARVKFNEVGDPTGVERLGIALEPEADYELRPDGGGCEDARITFVEPLKQYVMTYTAYSSRGPRIALARSKDLFHWERTGLATFSPYDGISLDEIDNKDASLFPVAIPNPSGNKEIAILHRPLFPGTNPEETVKKSRDNNRKIDLNRESIWISYCSIEEDVNKEDHFGKFTSHHRLASPAEKWEQLKIGGGAPPLLTRHSWLLIYHGVSETKDSTDKDSKMCYAAGAMILSKEHPQQIKYRSVTPILIPDRPYERKGTVNDVVFPTGLDRRDDIGMPDRIDVYYGMADSKIGVATLQIPETLPATMKKDALEEIG